MSDFLSGIGPFDIFDVLSLVGGISLFLFGMQLMGNALEKKAGGQLKTILAKLTDNPFKGFMLGMVVTAIIQASGATTVMVVGFVNSGVMTLRQAIRVIMGANIGTTITAWILSMSGIEGSGVLAFFKPTSFVPLLALIGIFLFMFVKDAKKKDTGLILMGFATLMTGMNIMTESVAGLKDVPAFTNFLTLFNNPIFGVVAGAVLTAIIQSSSASVGILQALSSTGAVTFGSAIPIIMGQNIGTCVTALFCSVGANKAAKRTAFVHLYFNVLGTVLLLSLFCIAKALFNEVAALDAMTINQFQIATVHTAFNVICTAIWFPLTGLLEKLACLTVRDTEEKEKYEMLDERLLSTPSLAVDRSKNVADTMAEIAVGAIHKSFELLSKFGPEEAERVLKAENKVDKFEDRLGTYLVHLSSLELSEADSVQTTKLLHIISDFERISDHAVNILNSAEEKNDKKLHFSKEAKKELAVMINAVNEIVDLAYDCFVNENLDSAIQVEPLEQVVDKLKAEIKSKHIARLQKGECTIELGFILSDIVTNLERISDHCSNIAACMIEMSHSDMKIHKYLRNLKREEGQEYTHYHDYFSMKYDLNKS